MPGELHIPGLPGVAPLERAAPALQVGAAPGARIVLLVHPDAEHRLQLRRWLGGVQVVEAATRDQALETLRREAPALLLSHHTQLQGLLRDLERLAPATARAALCPTDDGPARESLARLVAEGHDFVTVDERSEAAVRGLVFARTSSRLTPRLDLRAQVRLETGAVHRLEVMDLGCDGLGLRAGARAPLDQLAPGVPVEVEVCTLAGVTVLEARPWVVRAVCRVGPELRLGLLARLDTPPGPAPRVADPVRSSGWLKRAALRGSRFEVRHVDRLRRASFATASLDEASGQLALRRPLDGSPGPRWHPGDLVRVSFQVGRLHTECATLVLATPGDGLVLATPRTALQRERRRAPRLRLEGAAASLRFRSPLDGTWATHRLLDLTPAGCAFSFAPQAEVFPPGLRLEEAQLELEGRRWPCEAVVQSTSPSGDGATRRCGLRLATGTEGRQAVLDLLADALLPPTRGSDSVPFGEVWQLFVDEGAGFPDHPPDRPGTVAVLDDAQQRLRRDGSLARSFVYREEGRVLGHAAGLRPYSHTWFSQHLLVRTGFHRAAHASQALVTLSFDYGQALEGIRYLRGAWGLSNRWAARVYGLATPRLVRPGRSYLHRFHLLRRPVAPLAPGRLRAFDTTEGAELLALLRGRLEPLQLAAEDLTEDELLLPTIGGRYARLGLRRARSLAVVAGHAPRGWALLEDLSPGCFWLEYYTASRFFLAEPEAPDAPEVLRALVAHTVERDRRLGRAVSTVLCSPDQREGLLELGFNDVVGPAFEFCAQASMAQEMTSELLTIFERLELRQALRPRPGATPGPRR